MTGPPYLLFGNGLVAVRFLTDVIARNYAPVGVILNTTDRQRDAATIRGLCDEVGVPVCEWSASCEAALFARVQARDAPWLLCVHFGHLLGRELLDAVDGRAVNLHAALLPWGKGVHTNVWPLIERTPVGVTLHGMVPRVDAGPILVQREVTVDPWDTAATLYQKLEDAEVALLRDAWPTETLARWPGVAQRDAGSIHRIRDMETTAHYSLDEHPEARALYDLLRARTWSRLAPLRIVVDGQCVEATIHLTARAGP
jgi:methionyl-tRNA formyltransferase